MALATHRTELATRAKARFQRCLCGAAEAAPLPPAARGNLVNVARGRYRLQYGSMADNSGSDKSSSRLYEFARKRRVLWWTGGAVVLTALVVVAWLERKRIPFSAMPEWISHPPEWLLLLGLVTGGLLALAVLWKVPQWQVGFVKDLEPKERFDRVNEVRKTLATILGGILLLAGGFFTWQNLNLAREGQITDRFYKAIEQLGSEMLQIRLGGISALEGIANESEALHWPIMEVLCTYVRVNAPRKPQESTIPNPPPADIQAILTVLGRRDRKYEKKNQVLDLKYTDLRDADLFQANLIGAKLFAADPVGANHRAADLSGADLQGADLDGAWIKGAYLSGGTSAGRTSEGLSLSLKNKSTQLPATASPHYPTTYICLEVGCDSHRHFASAV